MSTPTSTTDARTDVASLDALPSVLVPGTHGTPDGYVETSTAMFADGVLANIPDAALLFRMGDVVGRLTGATGARRFDPLDADAARLLIDRHVRLVASAKDPDTGEIYVTYIPCGKDAAGLVLAAAKASPLLRPLRAVVNYPVYLPGWTLAVAGYNPGANVFYDEPVELRGIEPDLVDPMAVLDDVIDGFPFKAEADRENALGFMVTLAIRHALDGNVPGFLVRAHRERTGKTYLVRTMAVAVRGEEPALLQFGSTEEEREKRINGELLRGRNVSVFDNLPAGESVESPALAMLLTCRTWTGRILGKTGNPTLPNETTVAMTGNNIGASGEIAQRLVPIHLAADTANPQDRTGYAHEEPVAYARARIRAVHAAIQGLVERWKAAGRQPFLGVAFGGFEAWTKAVGGILAASGSVNFLRNLRDWQESADEFGADAAILLADWYRETYGSSGGSESPLVQAKAVRERAERLELFARFRQGGTAAAVASTFGKRVLGVIVDRIFAIEVHVDDQRERRDVVVRKQSSGSTSLYRLELVR